MHSLEAQLNNLSSNIFELKIGLIVLEKSRVIFIFRVSIQIPLNPRTIPCLMQSNSGSIDHTHFMEAQHGDGQSYLTDL